MPYSQVFEDALVYAARVHAGQARKVSGIPYIAHLLAVAALVAEDGGSETEVIAALLHDAPEDQGGLERLEDIRTRFGEDVARIVADCSDTFEVPKPPWRARKEAYLTHLQTAMADVLRVSAADKLHNARSTLADLRRLGDEVFERFHGKKAGTLWYFRAIADAFHARSPGPLSEELSRTVAEMHRLAGVQDEVSGGAAGL